MHDGEQLEADPLIVVDRVELHHPIRATNSHIPTIGCRRLTELFLRDRAGPLRWRERHRAIVLSGREEDGRTERLLVRSLGCQWFTEFTPRFAAVAHFGVCLQTQPAVARAIAVDMGADLVEVFRLVTADVRGFDPAVGHIDGEKGAVQQQRDIRLADDFVIQQQIEQLPAALRIVGGVVEANLVENAPFAPAGPAAAVVGPDDVHLDLATGVPTQPRAVLHEHHAGTVPGRGDGRANTGHPATGNEHVALELDLDHVGFARRTPIAHPGRGNRGDSTANLRGRRAGGRRRIGRAGADNQRIAGGSHAGTQHGQEITSLHVGHPLRRMVPLLTPGTVAQDPVRHGSPLVGDTPRNPGDSWLTTRSSCCTTTACFHTVVLGHESEDPARAPAR